MIVDTSIVIDAVAGTPARTSAAVRALDEAGRSQTLYAPGLLGVEILSGLKAVAARPGHPFPLDEIPRALARAEELGITIEAMPWADVHRAWELSTALRYTDALFVAAAERHGSALLTSDARIGRAGAPVRCRIITVSL